MKAVFASFLFLLGLTALPAVADHEPGRAFGFRPYFRVQQPPPGYYKGDRGRDPRRNGQPERRESNHQGRLTDEERRDLRRDLDKANRELYRRPPPRR